MTIHKFFYFSLLFALLSFYPLTTYAQSEEEDSEESETYARIKPHHSVSMEVGLPVSVRNKNFNGYIDLLTPCVPIKRITVRGIAYRSKGKIS